MNNCIDQHSHASGVLSVEQAGGSGIMIQSWNDED
jgi:hypothetical protein